MVRSLTCSLRLYSLKLSSLITDIAFSPYSLPGKQAERPYRENRTRLLSVTSRRGVGKRAERGDPSGERQLIQIAHRQRHQVGQ